VAMTLDGCLLTHDAHVPAATLLGLQDNGGERGGEVLEQGVL